MVNMIEVTAPLCGLNTGNLHVQYNCKQLFRLHRDTRYNNLTTTNGTINLVIKLIRIVDFFVVCEVYL